MNGAMCDMRRRFGEAREKCPGMPEEVYQLADYLAKHINDEIVPSGITIALCCVIDDIGRGQCGFNNDINSFPDYLIVNKSQVLTQMCYILQVIDEVTDAEFADAVRIECGSTFGWCVPKRVYVSEDKEDYPAYVKAAVDWWAGAIQHPKVDDAVKTLRTFMTTLGIPACEKNFSEDKIDTFRSKLAVIVISEIEKRGWVDLSVGFGPDRYLEEAGQAAGIISKFDFPSNTFMDVTKDRVTVQTKFAVHREVIWEAE